MQWVICGHKIFLDVDDEVDKRVFIKCLKVAWNIVRIPI